MAKKHKIFHMFSRNDDEKDYERYEEDASFKMPIEDIIEGIKNGSIKKIKDNHYLNVEDFLERDENGKTLLELIYDYRIDLDAKINTLLVNDINIIKECLKNKYSILIYKPNKYTLLNSAIKSSTLFEIIDNNESLIEIIIKKDLANLYIIKSINDIRILDLCRKYNRLDLIQYLNEELLFNKYENFNTLFEYLMSKNLVNENMIANLTGHPEVIELCKKYNKLYLLKHAKQNFLTYKFRNGETVIECLIKANQADQDTFYNLGSYNKNEIINIIFKSKAYRYLVYYPEFLFTETSDGYYIDYVLNNYNKSTDLYLTHIKVESLPLKSQAILYLKCADKGLLKFLPKLNENNLLEIKDNKTLLSELLRIDKNNTLNKVLNTNLYSNSNIALALSFFGVIVHGVDVPVVNKEKGKERKNKYLNIEIPKEIETKIYNLSRLFIMDGESDKDLVDVLVASYKNLAKSGYIYLETEIDLLTKYKMRNPNFTITKTDKGAYFSFSERKMYLNDLSIDAFNHELGHALHTIGSNRGIPRRFKNAIANIHSDPKGLLRVDMYSQKYHSIEDLALKEAERIYQKEYGHYFDINRTNKIKQLIQLDKQEKLERYKDVGIKESVLSSAIDNLYECNEEEYVEEFKRIKIEEIKTNLLYEKYTAMSALGDILDAIYQGRLMGDLLRNPKGEPITITFGHGLYYFNDEQSMFDEIIADYSQIIKEKDGKEVIGFLRYIVGDNFVDMISDYYEKEVLNHIPEKMPIEGVINHGR